MDEYKSWLEKEHSVDSSHLNVYYYETVSTRIKIGFESSAFWKHLIDSHGDFGDEYWIAHGCPLYLSDSKPILHIKPFESFLLKTFRKNVLQNQNWPSPPYQGWLLPDNWFDRINDTVRTMLVVKYLDGVSFLAEKIRHYCDGSNVPFHVDLEAKEEGYYAAHVYTRQRIEVPSPRWDTHSISPLIEIQITTQLQELIRMLLHQHYEVRRKAISSTGTKWQWDHQSEEFATNYLGHILHYVEGMVVGIRERQNERIR
jgi:hypothetical protein